MQEQQIIQDVIEKLQKENPKNEYDKIVLHTAINNLKIELNEIRSVQKI